MLSVAYYDDNKNQAQQVVRCYTMIVLTY